jgi:hypothetical protein
LGNSKINEAKSMTQNQRDFRENAALGQNKTEQTKKRAISLCLPPGGRSLATAETC